MIFTDKPTHVPELGEEMHVIALSTASFLPHLLQGASTNCPNVLNRLQGLPHRTGPAGCPSCRLQPSPLPLTHTPQWKNRVHPWVCPRPLQPVGAPCSTSLALPQAAPACGSTLQHTPDSTPGRSSLWEHPAAHPWLYPRPLQPVGAPCSTSQALHQRPKHLPGFPFLGQSCRVLQPVGAPCRTGLGMGTQASAWVSDEEGRDPGNIDKATLCVSWNMSQTGTSHPPTLPVLFLEKPVQHSLGMFSLAIHQLVAHSLGMLINNSLHISVHAAPWKHQHTCELMKQSKC